MKKNVRDFAWPVIGFLAVVVSGWLLFHELRGLSLEAVWTSLTSIPPHRYLLAAASTLVAYAALAGYDRIALLHLGVRHISWLFVSLCSFTTYALSHNIGASVFSGAMVRYRAYSTKGLERGASRRARRPVLVHLRPRHDPARRPRPDDQSRASSAAGSPRSVRSHQPDRGARPRPGAPRLRGPLRHRFDPALQAALHPDVQDRISPSGRHAAPARCRSDGNRRRGRNHLLRAARDGKSRFLRRARRVSGLVLGGAAEPCAGRAWGAWNSSSSP